MRKFFVLVYLIVLVFGITACVSIPKGKLNELNKLADEIDAMNEYDGIQNFFYKGKAPRIKAEIVGGKINGQVHYYVQFDDGRTYPSYYVTEKFDPKFYESNMKRVKSEMSYSSNLRQILDAYRNGDKFDKEVLHRFPIHQWGYGGIYFDGGIYPNDNVFIEFKLERIREWLERIRFLIRIDRQKELLEKYNSAYESSDLVFSSWPFSLEEKYSAIVFDDNISCDKVRLKCIDEKGNATLRPGKEYYVIAMRDKVKYKIAVAALFSEKNRADNFFADSIQTGQLCNSVKNQNELLLRHDGDIFGYLELDGEKTYNAGGYKVRIGNGRLEGCRLFDCEDPKYIADFIKSVGGYDQDDIQLFPAKIQEYL